MILARAEHHLDRIAEGIDERVNLGGHPPRDRPMACAPCFFGRRRYARSAHDGGVDHHVFVVVIAGQEPENPLENAALGPSVETLIDDLPVAKALGQIALGDAGAIPEENGFDEQPIVRRRSAHMAFTPRKSAFDPIPLVIAQGISSHRSAPPRADHS